jgi:hypothetical protein
MSEGQAVEIGKLCLGLAGGADGCVRSVADFAATSASALQRAGQTPERLFERVVVEHWRAWSSAMARSSDRTAIEAVEAALADELELTLERGFEVVPVAWCRPDGAVNVVLERLGVTPEAGHCDLATLRGVPAADGAGSGAERAGRG